MTKGFENAKKKVNEIVTLLEEIEEERMGLAEAAAFSNIMGSVTQLREDLEERLEVLEDQKNPIISWMPNQHLFPGSNND